MGGIFLQVFILVNVFLIGVVSAIGLRHALAHFRPHAHDADRVQKPTPPAVRLAPEVKEKLLQDAQKNYQKILDNAAGELQLDLARTSEQLNKKLDALGNQIVTDEMKRYQKSMEELQQHTEQAVHGTQEQLDKHQDDLKTRLAERQKQLEAKLDEDIAAEKELLIAQIDTKLADAAASFLLETMQHDVDLGAQTTYLTKMIEEHKDEFKKEVGGESTAA